MIRMTGWVAPGFLSWVEYAGVAPRMHTVPWEKGRRAMSPAGNHVPLDPLPPDPGQGDQG